MVIFYFEFFHVFFKIMFLDSSANYETATDLNFPIKQENAKLPSPKYGKVKILFGLKTKFRFT